DVPHPQIGPPPTAPLCITNCQPPTAIASNGAALPAGPYIIGFSITYACIPGYTLSSVLTLTCNHASGTFGSWQPTSAIPTCRKDNRDLDIVFLVESNDNVEVGTTCADKSTALSVARPFGPGGVLTATNFPVLYQQQVFLQQFESAWVSVNQANTKLAVHQHQGTCPDQANAATKTIRLLNSNANLLTYWTNTYVLNCGTPSPATNLVCANTHYFTTANGGSANTNVLILALPDITVATGYTGVLGGAQQTAVNGIRNSVAEIFTISLLRTTNPNYATNQAYLSMLACNSATCNKNLGSIYDAQAAVNVLAAFYP
uniref:Sushi domain-containing protein n=1 Tax=Ciona savignyi TaxID=51511 RepID=H2YQN8_CIOSA